MAQKVSLRRCISVSNSPLSIKEAAAFLKPADAVRKKEIVRRRSALRGEHDRQEVLGEETTTNFKACSEPSGLVASYMMVTKSPPLIDESRIGVST
jgi:hypothetical protein